MKNTKTKEQQDAVVKCADELEVWGNKWKRVLPGQLMLGVMEIHRFNWMHCYGGK